LVLALLLSACATPQAKRLTEGLQAQDTATSAALDVKASGAALPVSSLIENVPFFGQSEFQCGPAALAMLARHAGVPLLPDDLMSQVYVPGRKGSFQAEMLAAARRQGLVAYSLSPALEDLMREVAAGHQVLVFQNLALQFYPMWHYAVVIGYDRAKKRIVLHSGLNERLDMSLYTFEHTWRRGGYWSMVALPPFKLPATARADGFSAAAAGLERVNAAAAATAYETALAKWPGTREALLGIGNAAYAQGQKEMAAARFADAVQTHPDFADAWNNLAQVRLELGQKDQAAEAAAKAVALGGARLPRYQALQQQIEKARNGGPVNLSNPG
jgi:hypothetical protein